MSERTTINISITPQLSQFISAKVKTGRYMSVSEVVREALRAFEEQERAHDTRLAELKAQIQLGIDQIERGQTVSGEEVFRKTRARIKKHQKNNK